MVEAMILAGIAGSLSTAVAIIKEWMRYRDQRVSTRELEELKRKVSAEMNDKISRPHPTSPHRQIITHRPPTTHRRISTRRAISPRPPPPAD